MTHRILTEGDELKGMMIKCQLSSLLPAGRELLLEMAIKAGFTHILWIDDDTQFTTEAFDSLLSRDVDFVAANFCRKQLPLTYTALGLDGQPINSHGKTGVEEVLQIGMGMCLMNLDIFKDFPKPHFEVMWWDQVQQYVGEDIYLCYKLKQKGIKMYVDHEATAHTGHVGDYAYKFEINKPEDKIKDAA